MLIQDISFLTDLQKSRFLFARLFEIKGNNLDDLRDILTYGEAKKSQRLVMYMHYLHIQCVTDDRCGVEWLTVVDKSQIASNINLLAVEQKKIVDTAQKIMGDSAMRWKLVQEEAESIQIDVFFIREIADWYLMFEGDYNREYSAKGKNLDSFNKLLKRNKITRIKTNEKEVFELVIKKASDNWLFKLLTK